MTRTDAPETPPDDLADGVYRDADGDLWLVQGGLASVLTDTLGYQHGLGDLVLSPADLGSPIAADAAHAAYSLRMIRSI